MIRSPLDLAKRILGSTFSLSIRGLGSLGNFFLLGITSRTVGISDAGQLFNSIALGYAIAVFFNFGMRRSIIQNLGGSSFLKRRRYMSSVTSIHAAYLFPAFLILYIIPLPEEIGFLKNSIPYAAALVVLFNISDAMKANGKINSSFLLESILPPWITSLTLLVVSQLGVSFLSPFKTLLGATVVTILLFLSLNARETKSILKSTIKGRTHTRAFLNRSQLAFWISGVLVMASVRLPGVGSPYFLTKEAIGILAIVISISSIGGTIILVGQSIFGRHFALGFRNRDAVLLKSQYRQSRIFLFGFTSIFSAILAIFHQSILILFGVVPTEFPVFLLFFSIGSQLFRSFFGSCEMLLAMSTKPKLELYSHFFGLVSFIFTLIILDSSSVASWVYASVTSICIKSIICGVFVHRVLTEVRK